MVPKLIKFTSFSEQFDNQVLVFLFVDLQLDYKLIDPCIPEVDTNKNHMILNQEHIYTHEA